MKQCLKKILKNAKVTSVKLQTVLVEKEATLNSRHLPLVSSREIEEPLNPCLGEVYWLGQTRKKFKTGNWMLENCSTDKPIVAFDQAFYSAKLPKSSIDAYHLNEQ